MISTNSIEICISNKNEPVVISCRGEFKSECIKGKLVKLTMEDLNTAEQVATWLSRRDPGHSASIGLDIRVSGKKTVTIPSGYSVDVLVRS